MSLPFPEPLPRGFASDACLQKACLQSLACGNAVGKHAACGAPAQPAYNKPAGCMHCPDRRLLVSLVTEMHLLDSGPSVEVCRLNFRLATACDDDIQTLCAEECGPFMGQACGGRVLRCLTEKQDSIKNPECASEVFYFEKMEVNDFRNDVLLAEACRSDVDKFCKHTQPGACWPGLAHHLASTPTSFWQLAHHCSQAQQCRVLQVSPAGF